jgi:hypothetical protein
MTIKQTHMFFKLTLLLSLTLFCTSYDYVLSTAPQFTVGTFSTTNNTYPTITTYAPGKYLITWTVVTNSSYGDIYYIIYDSGGNVIQVETKVSTSTLTCCSEVAVDYDGGFIISWWVLDATTPTTYEIRAIYCDKSFKTSSEVQIFPVRKLPTRPIFLAVTFTGQYFLVCHNLDMGDGGRVQQETYCQPLTNSLNMSKVGSIKLLIPADPTLDSSQLTGSFAYLDSNLLVYVYHYYQGSINETRFTFVDGDLNIGNIVTVASSPNTQVVAKLYTNDSNGAFVIAWNIGDSYISNIKASIYDYSGKEIITDILVNTVSGVDCQAPDVKGLDSEGFIVNYTCFSRSASPYKDIVYYQLFSNDGTKVGIERMVGGGSNLYSRIDVTLGRGAMIILPGGARLFKINVRTLVKDGDISIPCYASCATCNEVGNSLNHLCSTCNVNYYSLEDRVYNCYNLQTPPTGYYLDINIWRKCYSLCKECTGYPSNASIDMLCKSCIDTYSPKVDNTSSCFTGSQDNYYFDGTLYQKCDSRCNSKLCLSGYYHKEDDSTNCFTGLQPNYYLDINLYKKCYETCQYCKTIGNIQNHQCETCVSNYYPKIDNPTSCFTNSQDYYYLYNNMYKQCYPTCLKCAAEGSENNHQCIICIPNYFPKSDNMTSCFTGFQHPYYLNTDYIYTLCETCSPKCPPLTAYDSVSNSCVNCKQGEIVYNNVCTDQCPVGFIKDLYTCISCQDKNLKYYNNQCLDNCPDGSIYNQTTNVCKDSCDFGYYQEGVGCEVCSSINKYYYNDQCLDECPENTIAVKAICQPYITLSGKQ